MGMGGGEAGAMVMHMTFFWDDRVEILFSGWPGDRGLCMYLLAVLLVAISSVLLECLSSLSDRLWPPPTMTAGRRASVGVLLTVVHAVRMGLAYLVMLAVMSFNVGVLMAAVAGHAVGFLFARSGIFRCCGDRNRDVLISMK